MKPKFFAILLVPLLLIASCTPAGTPTGSQPQATEPPAAPPTAAPTQTPTATPSPTPIPPKPEPTRVEFQAEDGRALVGYFYPSPYPNVPVVVLMHDAGSTQQDWVTLGMVDWLQNWPAGGGGGLFAPAKSIYPPMPQGLSFAVFTFDFRGFGESLPVLKTWAAEVWLMDAEAAYVIAKILPGVDPTRVVGIGASIGADGVVDACGEGCLGSLSRLPGSYLDMPYAEAVKALDDAGKPVWCVAHQDDRESAPTCASASGDYYKSIIYTEPPKKHGMRFLLPDTAPQDIGQNILDFLFVAFNITP